MPRPNSRTSNDLTVDFKTISSIPMSTRMKLVPDNSFMAMIQQQLTPGQITSLFPRYYLEGLNPLAGQLSETGLETRLTGSESKRLNDLGLSGYSGSPNGQGTQSQQSTAVPSKTANAGEQNKNQREALGGVPAPLAQKAVDAALQNEGRSEVRDKQALREYIKTGGANLDPSQTAWCAAYVNASLAAAGLKGSDSNVANSFQTYGQGVGVDQIQGGDVVVNTRGRRAGETGGHVMMATGNVQRDESGKIVAYEIVGGNEGNSVKKHYVPVSSGFMIRRATENEVKDPKVLEAYKSPETAKTQQVADQTTKQIQIGESQPETDTMARPLASPIANQQTADNTATNTATDASAVTPAPTETPAVTSTLGTSPQVVADSQTVGDKSAQPTQINTVVNAPVQIVPEADTISKSQQISQAETQPTIALARGGTIDSAHLAVPLDPTSKEPNKLIGEAGPEQVVPRNKIDSKEVGQQKYQGVMMTMFSASQPTPAPTPPPQQPTQPQTVIMQGPTQPTQASQPNSSAIGSNHPMVPPSARKAYADSKFEPRLNNLSPLGTVYTNHGQA